MLYKYAIIIVLFFITSCTSFQSSEQKVFVLWTDQEVSESTLVLINDVVMGRLSTYHELPPCEFIENSRVQFPLVDSINLALEIDGEVHPVADIIYLPNNTGMSLKRYGSYQLGIAESTDFGCDNIFISW